MKKKGILIQARLSSSRFPGKMLNRLGEVPLVQYVFNRCKISSQIDLVGVVTRPLQDMPAHRIIAF
jgi:spore coat polysaccharide biosynthesis protein SpsF